MPPNTMNPNVEKARRIEAEFLTAVQRNIGRASGWIPGTLSQRPVHANARDQLRQMMLARQMYDLSLLDRLPQNRRVTFRGYERTWYWFGRRRVSAVTAAVLSPLETCLSMETSGGGSQTVVIPPVDGTTLVDHLRQVTVRDVPTQIIGVCSPSGFTEDARRVGFQAPGVTVVLIEPRPDGGWRVAGLSGPYLDRACELFDAESRSQKIERIRRTVAEQRGQLFYTGLSAGELAKELDLPEVLVEEAFHRMAAEDPRLHVTQGERACILYYTSTVPKEARTMSVLEFLKRILGRQASPEEKVRELRAKQAEIDEERRNLEKALDELVGQESRFLKEGAAATSLSVRKRLASRVAQIRQEIALQNEKVSILTKQGQILGRQIHNLEVAQAARPTGLPASEEITEAAAAAEGALEELEEAYETVRTVNRTAAEHAMTPEEEAILAEFEAQAAKQAPLGEEAPSSEVAEKTPPAAGQASAGREIQDD